MYFNFYCKSFFYIFVNCDIRTCKKNYLEMINYNLLNIRRVIMHRILPKTSTREHVVVENTTSLVVLTDEIAELLLDRIRTSCGKESQTFELGILNDEVGSCFSKINSLKSFSDENFIAISKEIAELLAEAQDTKSNVPGGYFLLVDAIDGLSNHDVYIILKAEPQDALSDLGTSIAVLKKIFLSPAQKMYKVGVFEHIDESDISKDSFKAYLFDSQFNSGSKLAEYFYKDFLGLTIDGFGNLQTKTFYDLYNQTVDKVFKDDIDKKNDCKRMLQAECLNQSLLINPLEFIRQTIPVNDRDKFIAKITPKFPIAFTKDTSLINKKINNRTMLVADDIKLVAPTERFSAIDIETDPNDRNIKIIRVRTNVN